MCVRKSSEYLSKLVIIMLFSVNELVSLARMCALNSCLVRPLQESCTGYRAQVVLQWELCKEVVLLLQ